MEDNLKSIKVDPFVHKELKVYCANSGHGISDVVGLSILEYLKSVGHKFITPTKKSSISLKQ